MRERLKLGAYLDSGDYMTLNQLFLSLGLDNGGTYRNVSWIEKRKLPIRKRTVQKSKRKTIKIEDFWKWAEANQDFLDFSNFEENALGAEPKWAKEKRKRDLRRKREIKTHPWTKTEDEKLERMYASGKFYISDVAKELNRAENAISRRIYDLALNGYGKWKRHDNHKTWGEEEYKILGDGINNGEDYETIAGKLGKSVKSVRGFAFRHYLTENIDNIRSMMCGHEFGYGKPIKRIKNFNAMTAQEKKEVMDLLIRLQAILQWKFKQDVANTEFGQFFQRDMCQNFCADCLKCDGCDTCTEYKKIEPQNCKMCGMIFWHKKKDLYCPRCRMMRKKQWIRKKIALGGF